MGQREAVDRSAFNELFPPIGRWTGVGCISHRTAERLNVWRIPSSGGTAEQVTHHGGNGPTVSPDGKLLYYVKDIGSGEASLWRAPLEGGEEVQLVPRIHRYSYAVTPPRGVYYVVPQSSDSAGTIEFLDPATGKHSILGRTDKSLDLGVTVSPDGRYLLYAQIDNLGSNLMMIDNFR